MSKNLIRLCVLVAVSCGLTGCVDSSTPSGILQEAGNAAHSQDFETFKATLSGSAKEKFGTQAGMNELLKKFSGLTLDIGNEELLKEEKVAGEDPAHPGFTFTVTTRDYHIPIFSVQNDSSESRRVAMASVQCVAKHSRPSLHSHFYTTCLITDFSELL